MRLILLLFVVVISFLGCSKKKDLLNSDFKYFVGNWKSINGSQNIFIHIKSNGKTRILKENERDITLSISSLDEQVPSEDGWKRYVLGTKGKNHLKAYLNLTSDTARFTVGSLIENGIVQYSDCFGDYINYNIIFVRQ